MAPRLRRLCTGAGKLKQYTASRQLISLLPENSYIPILATSESCFGCVVDRGGLSVASLGNFTLDLGIFDSVPGKDLAFRDSGPALESMEENPFPGILHRFRVF